MDYVLISAFAIGLLLFVLSWLRIIFASFGHHFLTGLVSLLPVVNMLILPTVWHKVYGWFLAGLLGLLVAVIAWFAGADKRVHAYTHQAGITIPKLSSEVVATGDMPITTEDNAPNASNGSSNLLINSNNSTPAMPLGDGKELPKTALYRMAYQKVNINQLSNHIGQYIRITQINRRTLEGKLLSISNDHLVLERRVNGGLMEQQILKNEIETTEVMTKEED